MKKHVPWQPQRRDIITFTAMILCVWERFGRSSAWQVLSESLVSPVQFRTITRFGFLDHVYKRFAFDSYNLYGCKRKKNQIFNILIFFLEAIYFKMKTVFVLSIMITLSSNLVILVCCFLSDFRNYFLSFLL